MAPNDACGHRRAIQAAIANIGREGDRAIAAYCGFRSAVERLLIVETGGRKNIIRDILYC
jgi:hypothetical protein